MEYQFFVALKLYEAHCRFALARTYNASDPR